MLNFCFERGGCHRFPRLLRSLPRHPLHPFGLGQHPTVFLVLVQRMDMGNFQLFGFLWCRASSSGPEVLVHAVYLITIHDTIMWCFFHDALCCQLLDLACSGEL